MARFIANSNILALLSKSSRRCFSSAAIRAGRSGAEEGSMMRGSKSMEGGAKTETVWTTSWVPDPVTGYYRPANRVGEMDPAELRQMLISRRSS